MERVNFKSGEIIYNEFHIDFSKPFSEQLDSLVEDLMQVKYADGYLLDVGWYPEYDADGKIVIQLIKAENWSNPKYKYSCRSLDELKKSLETVINHVNKQCCHSPGFAER